MRTKLPAITLTALLGAVSVSADELAPRTFEVCEGQATVTQHVEIDEQGAYLVHFTDHKGNATERFPFPNKEKFDEEITDMRTMVIEEYLDMHRYYAALGNPRALRGC